MLGPSAPGPARAQDFGARAGEGPGLRRLEGAVPTALRWARPALRSCLLERRERCRAYGACRELDGQLCCADGVASAEPPRASLLRLPLRRQAGSTRMVGGGALPRLCLAPAPRRP